MKKTSKTMQSATTGLNRLCQWMLLAAILLGLSFKAHAAKVLFVTTGSQRDTTKFINILKAQGHDLTVWNTTISGNALTAAAYQADGYQLLIVDEVISSGAVGANFKDSPIPVINWEGFLYNSSRSSFVAPSLAAATYPSGADAAAANGGAGADCGQVQNTTDIIITNPSHPLAAGLSAGSVNVFDPSAPNDPPVADGVGVVTFVGGATLISGATPVATVPGYNGGYAILGVDVGVTNYDGVTTNKARWVHLPWNDSIPGRIIIEPSFFLFEAAVAWSLHLPQPTKIRNLLPPSASLQTNLVVSFSVDKTTAAGSAVSTGNIQLKINGSNAISGAVITDGGTQWNVAYTNNSLPKNTFLTIVASATSADGGFSARQTQIDTFDSANFTWESEDFNFDGGQFFTSIVLCQTIGGGTDGCYFDRVGVTNIDKSELNGVLTIAIPETNEVYRFGPAVDREEYVDTFLSADALVRTQYVAAGIPDYEVRNIAINEWLNYTRSFPTGTFNIYARISSGNALNVQLDFVDNATTTSQNLTKIGRFVKSGATAGYEFIPLTDDTGETPIVIEITSTSPTTIRSTALTAGYVPNFYMLVPTAAPVNEPPLVTITSPTSNQVINEGTMVTIEANVTDDGTITNVSFYAGTAEPLTLLGEDNVGPTFSFPFTPPMLGQNLTYTIRVVARDDGGLSAQNEVTVKVVDPTLIILKPHADAQLNEYNGAVQDTSGNGPQLNTRTSNNGVPPAGVNEVIALRFDLGEYASVTLKDVSLNLINFRNNNAHILHYYGVNDGTVGLDNNGVTPGYTDNTWDEAGGANLKYSTMPGLFFDGLPTQGYDTNNVTDLGSQTMASGTKAVVVSFGSTALKDFVNNNPDNLITFLVDTDTQSTGQKRFASKEATELDGMTPSGAAGDFAPYLSFRVDAVAPTITITSTTRAGNQLTLNWPGGSPPYKIVKRTTITGTPTDELTDINDTTATVTISLNPNDSGFYQVQGN